MLHVYVIIGKLEKKETNNEWRTKKGNDTQCQVKTWKNNSCHHLKYFFKLSSFVLSYKYVILFNLDLTSACFIEHIISKSYTNKIKIQIFLKVYFVLNACINRCQTIQLSLNGF